MGTHPIFESDFDCLTDLRVEIRNVVWVFGRFVQAALQAPR